MKKNLLYVLLLCFVNISALFSQNSVYIQSSEFGRGILKSRPGECFVIAPLHVVEKSSGDISIVGKNNVLSTGEFIQGFSSDLAVIRINGGGTQECEGWTVPSNFSEIVNNSDEGFLELRNNNGSSKLMQVFFTEKDGEIITIEPKKNNQSFSKGMSGSSLFTKVDGKKIYLGMLQQIDMESGEGYVFQADDMERVLGGFF